MSDTITVSWQGSIVPETVPIVGHNTFSFRGSIHNHKGMYVHRLGLAQHASHVLFLSSFTIDTAWEVMFEEPCHCARECVFRLAPCLLTHTCHLTISTFKLSPCREGSLHEGASPPSQISQGGGDAWLQIDDVPDVSLPQKDIFDGTVLQDSDLLFYNVGCSGAWGGTVDSEGKFEVLILAELLVAFRRNEGDYGSVP